MKTRCDFPGCGYSHHKAAMFKAERRSIHAVPRGQEKDVAKRLGLPIRKADRIVICRHHFRENSINGRSLRKDVPFEELLEPPAQLHVNESSQETILTLQGTQTETIDEVMNIVRDFEDVDARIKRLETNINFSRLEMQDLQALDGVQGATEDQSEVDVVVEKVTTLESLIESLRNEAHASRVRVRQAEEQMQAEQSVLERIAARQHDDGPRDSDSTNTVPRSLTESDLIQPETESLFFDSGVFSSEWLQDSKSFEEIEEILNA